MWAVVAMGDRGDVASVGGRRRRWWWLGKKPVWLLSDAKPNVGVCRHSFGKVAPKMTYINLCLYAQEQLLGLVVILPLFCYIISMEAVVQSLPMHFLFIIIIITAAILM